jgi:preprotein translocase subunit SecF
MHLMRRKELFFILSSLVILPGLFFLVTSGLKLGIDFTGGALLEYKFEKPVSSDQLSSFGQVTPEGNNTYLIKTKPLDQNQIQQIDLQIKQKVGNFEQLSSENIGPTISSELKQKALLALLFSCVMIVLYITYAFRKVPKPASSLRFGMAAIVALIHDVLVVVGIFAILGHFFNVEIDTLFVTALLTIIGFSVHDTIVVFDRIRENLPKLISHKFTEVADASITQTLARSLNTSLTVVFVLLALLLFGGASIRWFVAALLIGVISGTYSSIFNATALLAWWEERLGH